MSVFRSSGQVFIKNALTCGVALSTGNSPDLSLLIGPHQQLCTVLPISKHLGWNWILWIFPTGLIFSGRISDKCCFQAEKKCKTIRGLWQKHPHWSPCEADVVELPRGQWQLGQVLVARGQPGAGQLEVEIQAGWPGRNSQRWWWPQGLDRNTLTYVLGRSQNCCNLS